MTTFAYGWKPPDTDPYNKDCPTESGTGSQLHFCGAIDEDDASKFHVKDGLCDIERTTATAA